MKRTNEELDEYIEARKKAASKKADKVFREQLSSFNIKIAPSQEQPSVSKNNKTVTTLTTKPQLMKSHSATNVPKKTTSNDVNKVPTNPTTKLVKNNHSTSILPKVEANNLSFGLKSREKGGFTRVRRYSINNLESSLKRVSP